MASLRVIQPGLMSTVQDVGRSGHAASGVPESGAVDRLSLRAGNRLLGNPDRAAAIEMTITGGECVFDDDATIALTGAAMPAQLKAAGGAQRDVPHATPVDIRAGASLSVGRAASGCRAYLCVRGGIDVPLVLASRSTCLPGGFGGFDGRALRAGDELRIGLVTGLAPPRACPSEGAAWLRGQRTRPVIRVVRSVHSESIPSAFEQLIATAWRASNQSNRGGVRLVPLTCPQVSAERRASSSGTDPRTGQWQALMISEGTPLGAIQLPDGGEPIILLNDRPTTGGYLMIACVIAADIAAVGQTSPGDALRFEEESIEAARNEWRDQQSELDRHLKPHANIEANG